MSARKAIVERYTEGFRRGELADILSCLRDDVVWELHGDKTLVGKQAFAAEADSGDGPTPDLYLDKLIEEGDSVAVVGHGCVALDGDPVDFVYSEVFHVRGRIGGPPRHLPRLAGRTSEGMTIVSGDVELVDNWSERVAFG